ncbi:outer membrane beta-barrel protein [Trichothermofontia sp.]
MDRSQLVNRLGTSLSHDLTSTVQLGLNYQYELTHFTQRDREDAYHQVLVQLSWDVSRSIRLNLYGGYSFGASTDSDVNFKGSILGAGMSFNLPLF